MTASPSPPTGQRFSHIYLQSSELLQDSQRARRRLASVLHTFKDLDDVGSYLVAELGVEVRWGMGGLDWPKTLETYALRDFLDLSTVLCRYLDLKRKDHKLWQSEARNALITVFRRVFAEEQLRYEIDDNGGIHFKVDEHFASVTNAAIAGLGIPRYANAREQFEAGMNSLSGVQIDAKQGLRSVFNSVECVFKLMYPRAPKLTSSAAVESLKLTLQKVYGDDQNALRAANKSVNAFADWVDGCHEYRHEHGKENPSQPPLDLAVQMIGNGSSFLRWLIALDGKVGSNA